MIAALRNLLRELDASVSPGPIRIFRIVAGLLVCTYLLHLAWLARDFILQDGLLDHELSRRLYWFTKLSILPAGIPDSGLRLVLLGAFLLSVLITVGVRTRWAAFGCFVLTVSLQRWIFVVYYVDDVAIQLVLFWLILLPDANSSSPPSLEVGRAKPRQEVPGLRVRLFLANVLLVYLVAGLTKLASPMWQDGTALYAVLRLPISRFPDFWRPEWLPALRGLSHAALAIEIAIPLLLTLPRRLGWRLLGLALQIGFHVGIVIAIGIPFANLALIATSILFFRNEVAVIESGLRKDHPTPPLAYGQGRLLPSSSYPQGGIHSGPLGNGLAVATLTALAVSALSRIAIMRPAVIAAFALLWSLGLAQNYRLFDWIDSRNYHRSLQVSTWSQTAGASELPAESFLPSGVRYRLLEMNLYDMVWLPGRDESLADDLKCSIVTRAARRFCHRHQLPTYVEVTAHLARLEPGNLGAQRASSKSVVAFECAGGTLKMLDPLLDLVGSVRTCKREI